MEASNVSHIEFKVVVVRMINDSKKDIETIPWNHSKMKNAIQWGTYPLKTELSSGGWALCSTGLPARGVF